MPGRNNRQVRQRWMTALSVFVKTPWTPEKNRELFYLVTRFGERWKEVAKWMGARTSRECRYRWASALDPELESIEADTVPRAEMAERGVTFLKRIRRFFSMSRINFATARDCPSMFWDLTVESVKEAQNGFETFKGRLAPTVCVAWNEAVIDELYAPHIQSLHPSIGLFAILATPPLRFFQSLSMNELALVASLVNET